MSTSELYSVAQGKWDGILATAGIPPQYLTGKHTACPMCGGRDRFRYSNFKNRGDYFCTQCGSGSGIDLMQRYLDMPFREVANLIEKLSGSTDIKKDRKLDKDPGALLKKMYSGSIELSKADNSNPVVSYLKERCVFDPALIPLDIRVKNNVGYYDQEKKIITGHYHAMLAMVRDAENNPNTLHVTYIDNYGHKAPVASPRKIMPPKNPMSGGAIRLYEPTEDGTIGIAEGIETAIAATMLTGIPTWSTLNTAMMEKVVLPEGITRVVIFADHDENYAGHKAAYALANRLAASEHKLVEVRIPTLKGQDFADIIEDTIEDEARTP
jgi:putative DNA primase/helicase